MTPTLPHLSIRPHFVVGHCNPDTDAIVSAHLLAWMYRMLDPSSHALPVRLGEANRQTGWLFETAGIALPPLRTSCLAQASEIARATPVADPDTPLREALEAIQRSGAPCAVVCDDNKVPLGIVSDRHPRTNFLLQCNVEDFFGTLLDFRHIVRGLPLTPLKDQPMPTAHHLEVVMHKHTFGGSWSDHTALVIGDRDLLLEVLARTPPAAVIISGTSPEHAWEIAARIPCPAFHFSGSVVNLCARLAGCLPCSAALETSFPTVLATTDFPVLEKKVRASPLGVLVVDEEGRLVGTLSADTLLRAPTPLVSLVDHSERRQSISGLERAELIEIVDHHRLGDIETSSPIAIDIRPVGSTATILHARAEASGLDLPPDMARLLLGALISDTLLLSSPTTTPADEAAASRLAAAAGVDLDSFGREVLWQNDELLSATPEQLVTRDCKEFAHGDTAFLLAQIETVSLDSLDAARGEDLRQSLLQLVRRHKSTFGLLMVTDVLRGCSDLILASDEPSWQGVFQTQNLGLPSQDKNLTWRIPGMVSRKKQLLPHVFAMLRERESL